jgi:hypothetical protein
VVSRFSRNPLHYAESLQNRLDLRFERLPSTVWDSEVVIAATALQQTPDGETETIAEFNDQYNGGNK